MKKYNIFLFCSIVVSFIFISCSSDLDLQPDGRIDVSGIFKDRSKVMGYLNSCYGLNAGPYIDRASYCDEAEDCDDGNPGSSIPNWYNGNLDASSYAGSSQDGSPWTSLYIGIRKCNIFLANIGTADIFATAEEKSGWTAQARTLRALYYLQLIRRYGDVPLLLSPDAINHDFSTDTKAKFSTVVKAILADCDSALTAPATQNGFPWAYPAGPLYYGAMSRAIAYAIKSEAVTYACSPLWADSTYTWAQATDINKEALSQCLTHDYKLFADAPVNYAAQNAYALYFITNGNDRSKDKETIYQGGAQMAIWQNAGMPTNPYMSKSGPCPSQELVDSYETSDGVPVLNLTMPYLDDQHLQPNYNTANTKYNSINPYLNRDPRFYGSIYYNGGKRNLGTPTRLVNSYLGGTDGLSTERTHTRTGYYVAKFNNWKSKKNSNSDGAIRVFRLAELYMNFAESAYQLAGGPDAEISLGSGLTMSARDAVNAVRARAGMPVLPTGLTATAFEARYRNERRVEFAFECQRFFDVRRWTEPGGDLSKTDKQVTGMKITKNLNPTTYTYIRFSFNVRNCWDNKWLLYPIDQVEANKMQGLTGHSWQNTGW